MFSVEVFNTDDTSQIVRPVYFTLLYFYPFGKCWVVEGFSPRT